MLTAAALAAPILAACSGNGAATDASSGAPPTELQAKYESVVDAVLPSVVQIITHDSTGSGVVSMDSGGALVNLSDQVLGIPTLAAHDADTGGTVPGIGFAIPSNTVRNIAGQLIKHGKVTQSGRATLDITGHTSDNAQGKPAGVAVIAVTDGGAAAKAGIRPGDLIVGMNGEAIPSLAVLESDLAAMKPGHQVSVDVRRNDSAMQVSATLDSLAS